MSLIEDTKLRRPPRSLIEVGVMGEIYRATDTKIGFICNPRRGKQSAARHDPWELGGRDVEIVVKGIFGTLREKDL